jgi:hypothetical protein
MLLFLWIGAHVLQLMFAIRALYLSAILENRNRPAAVWASLAASALSLATLALFLTVFVIGGSSHVAQLAGEQGFGLWRVWAAWWPLLLLSAPLALLVAIGAALWPPYPTSSFFSRICGVVAVGCACYATIAFFPDA